MHCLFLFLFFFINCRTTILNSGGNLLLSTLLPMLKRSGVFLCMEVVGKQLEFFLRSGAK